MMRGIFRFGVVLVTALVMVHGGQPLGSNKNLVCGKTRIFPMMAHYKYEWELEGYKTYYDMMNSFPDQMDTISADGITLGDARDPLHLDGTWSFKVKKDYGNSLTLTAGFIKTGSPTNGGNSYSSYPGSMSQSSCYGSGCPVPPPTTRIFIEPVIVIDGQVIPNGMFSRQTIDIDSPFNNEALWSLNWEVGVALSNAVTDAMKVTFKIEVVRMNSTPSIPVEPVTCQGSVAQPQDVVSSSAPAPIDSDPILPGIQNI